MSNSPSFIIYDNANQLPAHWDLLANGNIFLSTDYLRALDLSAPANMVCHYIGIYKDKQLCGIAISQFLDLNSLQSFGERDKCLKTVVRNFIFKNFSSHVLFMGNNMLTGQNSYVFSDDLDHATGLSTLLKASHALKESFRKRGSKIHLTSFKDFSSSELDAFTKSGFDRYYNFSIQPNMVFEVKPHWIQFEDYYSDLTKKYRDQYKRSQNRSSGIVKRKMNLAEIESHQDTIYDLYFHVARNAPFNTFFLAKHHFCTLKAELGDRFLFYGYFDDEKLIGFNTLIKNGDTLDTYFLGYDDSVQREKMLYLNMLYDMVGYAIKKGYREIVFARTALEIKSSIGAKPHNMYGFLLHENPLIHKKIDKIFNYLEPKPVWQQRSPFKT